MAYVDGTLRQTEKTDEPEMEARLNSSMRLFDFLQDKDMYAAHYRDALSKRLLNNKVSSIDMEKAMITKLKAAQVRLALPGREQRSWAPTELPQPALRAQRKRHFRDLHTDRCLSAWAGAFVCRARRSRRASRGCSTIF